MENTTTLTLSANPSRHGHPWVTFSDLSGDLSVDLPEFASVATLLDASGHALGSGLYDPRDPHAAWRRFSHAEDVAFDAAYIATAIQEALARRSDEHCQRLISSDADYLPGLEVELFEDILTISAKTAAVDAEMEAIVECLKEACEPQEIVFLNDLPERAALGLECTTHTLSGQNLKARWVEVDGLAYRLDWLNPEKPRFFLDQREQHALVGSLCEGRTVLDGYAHSGAFALQAARAGAEHVVAVDSSLPCIKAIGAQAQKNQCFVETVDADVAAFLAERRAGELDAIILDPPKSDTFDVVAVEALHTSAFNCLPEGGLLATYCRSAVTSAAVFETAVAQAATAAGREARIFARTAQPFDFPVLLSFPESRYLKGLILQVE